jgi:RpiB/LacA/LacB family sugar-phosphate isomerase
MKKLFIASDHASVALKEYVKGLLNKKKFEAHDLGPYGDDSVDYPDYAEKVALKVAASKGALGILSCGTGIGMSISANKIPGIRAALVKTPFEAQMSREHNDSNILVLGGRPFDKSNIAKIVDMWLKTGFAGGRHKKRVDKIKRLEKRRLAPKTK